MRKPKLLSRSLASIHNFLNSTCYFRFLYIFRSNCMNSTPGPVIFLLIVVPGRAIPSLSSNPINHGLINNMETKAKCPHLKNVPVNGLRGRRLSELIDWRYHQSSVMVVFSTHCQLCELFPLSLSLWLISPLPVWISILVYTYTLCKGGGYGVLGLRQMNTWRKVPLHVNFF